MDRCGKGNVPSANRSPQTGPWREKFQRSFKARIDKARRGEARLGVCWERANRDKGKVEENEGGFKGTVRRGKLVRVGEEKVC